MIRFKSLLFIFLIIMIISACQQPSSAWEVAYKSDKEGTTVQGSKQCLIDAIRLGADVKIGWGSQGKTRTIEHLSIPIWLAITDQKEVIAYLDPQVFADFDWETLSGEYTDPGKLQQEWRVVLSTQGTFDAVWYDRKADTLIKRVPQRHIMTWFIREPAKQEAIPLFDY